MLPGRSPLKNRGCRRERVPRLVTCYIAYMSDSRESFNLLNVAAGVLMVVVFFTALFIFERYFFVYWRPA
jgi:hypothetical protein